MTAGALIRSRRLEAGLSQAELARRAGVVQSVVSAYEMDRRDPGLSMLRKLIEATGHDLVLDTRPSPSFRTGIPDTPLGRKLRRHRRAVIAEAARRGAHDVRVFGSVARGEDHEGSDIDLLVELEPRVGLVGLVGIRRALRDLLGTEVDVVPEAGLKAGPRERILAEAIPL